ncbi:hypothetical protein SCP_0306320 [Sparassis crispa]|uniref:Uncharacterized protein n=1 Tax=Sparassis crispa TaxID=139825 RepID=A0A401GFK7_9APHY|nr:hypothetical protein SCP_0306320 [Sparassis crispa]GBE80911.1 hypothetical protein SCP_0306320 [Sparassis crispa]
MIAAAPAPAQVPAPAPVFTRVPTPAPNGVPGPVPVLLEPQSHPEASVRYLVNVIMYYTEMVKGAPHTGSRVSYKSTHVMKKGGAGTIETDDEFSVTLGAILKKRGCSVNVDFDVEKLEGFRLRKHVFQQIETANDTDEKLIYGTKVPHLEIVSDEAQLYGAIILELKKLHSCSDHTGEHSEPGYCYKGSHEHILLNNRRLKLWAAAIAAHDAMKQVPPNVVEFEALLIQQLAVSPLAFSAANPPSTPIWHTSLHSPPSTLGMPHDAADLHSFLVAFLEKKGIDMLSSEDALAAQELTPDIIPEVPLAHLCELTGAVEG